jgi:hypothetical protein
MVAELPSIGLSVPARNKPRRNVALAREETMKDLRSSRRLIKIWQRREKATIDHLVDTAADAKGAAGTTHSAFTASGLAVVLMRDMTDCMYNPQRWPHVDHFTGNELIVYITLRPLYYRLGCRTTIYQINPELEGLDSLW